MLLSDTVTEALPLRPPAEVMKLNIVLSTLLILLASLLTAQGTLLTTAANGEIEIENCARINNAETQFGPAVYGDDLVFLARPKRGDIDPLTRKTYFKLFRAPISRDGMPGNPKPFSVGLNSNYNEGPVSFTQEDRVIFFTRNLLNGGATVEDPSGKANLGIYSAYRAKYDWAGIRSLPFNGKSFSNQHPSVTPNGRRVFFASNREGGYGGYDLYFSDFREGRWSAAINLGPEVNTEGNEAFPHIHPSGRLFFSSNGHGGRGGYDLFLIDLSDRRWGAVINLPAPVNSPGNDVGISLTEDGKRAYLVSDRALGKGEDDIYLLRLKQGITSLQGPETGSEIFTLYDGAKSRRVVGGQVWLSEVGTSGRLPAEHYSFGVEDRSGEKRIVLRAQSVGLLPATHLHTDREGTLRLELTVGKTYELRVHKPGYAPATLRFKYTDTGPSRPLSITLQPADCRMVSGIVKDRKGGGIEAVPVHFQPENCQSAVISTTTDVAGSYEICVPSTCNFQVTASRAGYESGSAPLSAKMLTTRERLVFDLVLRPEGNVSRRGAGSQGAVMALNGVSFFEGSAILQEERSGDIDLLRRLLISRPDVELMIVAHADGPQNAKELVRLGEQRAEALRRALLRRGISDDRLRTVSYGNTRRVRPCTICGPEDYAVNSRLEAKLR